MEFILDVKFYRTEAGNEPVREWLKSLSIEDKKAIGEDIKAVQIGWPQNIVPDKVIKKLDNKLWEVRTDLDEKTARVLFTIKDGNIMLLLHGFYKKTQKTPNKDIDLAKRRGGLK